MASPVLDLELGRKGDRCPFTPRHRRACVPGQAMHGVSVSPDPRPEEPRVVCALGEWSTVLSRWGPRAGPASSGSRDPREAPPSDSLLCLSLAWAGEREESSQYPPLWYFCNKQGASHKISYTVLHGYPFWGFDGLWSIYCSPPKPKKNFTAKPVTVY